MRSDWLRYVSPKAIVQRELPCGEGLAETILRDEIVGLLAPEGGKFPAANGQNGGREHTPPPRKRQRTELHQPPTFASFDPNNPVAQEIFDPQTLSTHPPPQAGIENQLPQSDGTSMTQGVLDQWAMWLCKLPERFPRVPPRVFLWSMEAVGAGALRDITVAGGEGFGAWWVVRCWMDEWMGWIAEKGGFLDMDSDTDLNGDIIVNSRSDGGTIGG